jgi:hypothetical protein
MTINAVLPCTFYLVLLLQNSYDYRFAVRSSDIWSVFEPVCNNALYVWAICYAD